MSFNSIPAGKDLPNDIYVAIEIPANADPIKYEIDKDFDAIMVDRFMATPMFYPANYGYVPNTYPKTATRWRAGGNALPRHAEALSAHVLSAF